LLAGLGTRQRVIGNFLDDDERVLGIDARFKGQVRNGVESLVHRFGCLHTLHFRLPGAFGFLHNAARPQKGPVKDKI